MFPFPFDFEGYVERVVDSSAHGARGRVSTCTDTSVL